MKTIVLLGICFLAVVISQTHEYGSPPMGLGAMLSTGQLQKESTQTCIRPDISNITSDSINCIDAKLSILFGCPTSNLWHVHILIYSMITIFILAKTAFSFLQGYKNGTSGNGQEEYQVRSMFHSLFLYFVSSSCLKLFKSFNRPFLYTLWALALPSFSSAGFVHPGLLHTQSDFQRMASKISASSQPWLGSYWRLTPNSYAQTNYTPNAQSYLCRGACCSSDNSGYLEADVAAAYQLALRWQISGTTAYADTAVKIMNAWSSTLTGIGCTNTVSSNDYRLLAAIQGYQFANVGEIMRSYSGLTAANFASFQNMMRNIFYPVNHFDVANDGLEVYSSWELGSTASIMAIAVLTDNQTMFNEATGNFYYGTGNGGIAQMVYYLHPGYLGQTQESGRDQGHNTLSVSLLGVICAQAWNQGVDLYGFSNNRVLAAAEYVAKGNMNTSSTTYYTVPFKPYVYINGGTQINDTVFSTNTIGTLRPSWASIFNHYYNVKGIAAPYTQMMMNVLNPDGGAPEYGTNTGGYDQLGFQTLTFTLNTISQGSGPTGLTGYMVNNNVVLSWWGSVGATNYTVSRATSSSGPWSPIATNLYYLNPLTYTDVGPGSNTFYYVVQDESGTAGNQVKVNTNNQALNAYYNFDSSSGSTASDSSGNSNTANLNGNYLWVTGKINNGILLTGGYVSLPAGVVTSLSDFTIASWVYLNARSAGVRLFDFGFGTVRWMMFTAQASNGNACFEISVNDMGGAQTVCGSAPLPTGQWVHVAVTLLGTTGTYYLNGNVAGTNTNIYLAPFQLSGTGITAQNYIGKSQYSTDPYLNGTVDDFRIYYGALAASQVSSLYTSG